MLTVQNESSCVYAKFASAFVMGDWRVDRRSRCLIDVRFIPDYSSSKITIFWRNTRCSPIPVGRRSSEEATAYVLFIWNRDSSKSRGTVLFCLPNGFNTCKPIQFTLRRFFLPNVTFIRSATVIAVYSVCCLSSATFVHVSCLSYVHVSELNFLQYR